MKIRVIQSFGCYEAGQVFNDWPGGMCQILIGRGLIEEVRDHKPEVERAIEDSSGVETADASPRHVRKKGKS